MELFVNIVLIVLLTVCIVLDLRYRSRKQMCDELSGVINLLYADNRKLREKIEAQANQINRLNQVLNKTNEPIVYYPLEKRKPDVTC